jgi:hypothetical protein
MTERHLFHAHAERTRYRTIVDLSTMDDSFEPFTFAPERARFSVAQLEAIGALAERQAERFQQATHESRAELEKHRST